MPKRVLMIAFHFPPAAMGSGHLRTLGFVRYLPASGWDPLILSAVPRVYPRISESAYSLIPPGCEIHRTCAFDARRHFGISGKYPAILAQPDRWASWWFASVLRGLQLIRKHRIQAIWSTYPIMTAHCIAYALSRIAHVPWVADFRDPVMYSVSDENRFSVASQRRWERRVVERANQVVFTSPGAMRIYADKYPDVAHAERMTVIQNGFDEAAFVGLTESGPRPAHGPIRLLHSGLLYPDGRSPVPFFEALARLKAASVFNQQDLQVVLRASGNEAGYVREIQRLGLEGMVQLAQTVPYKDALAEQLAADGLLLFQGERYDRQIPAKLYDYLRVGRPIFALVGMAGDTANLLRETGGAELAPLHDVSEIQWRLMGFVRALQGGSAPCVDADHVHKYSRSHGAAQLAQLFDRVIA